MGYVFALAASLLFGLNGTVTKVIVDAGITPLQLTLFRVLGTAIIAGVALFATNRAGFRVTRRQFATLAFLGVVGVAVLQATYAGALQLLPVGITLLLEYTAVLMVALIAFLFLGERVRARLWVAIACVLVGLAVVAQLWTGALNPVGVILAVSAAVALAVYFLVGERQLASTAPLVVAFWTMAFAAVFWAIFSGWWTIHPATLTSAVSLGGNLAGIVLPLWSVIAWNILLGTFAPFLLSFLALARLSATAAGIVATAEVIFAFLFAWLWLGERLDPVQLVGAVVVLAAIILAQTARANSVVDADLALRTEQTPDVRGRT